VPLIIAMVALRTLVRGLFFNTFFLGVLLRLLPLSILLVRGLITKPTMTMISVEVLTYEIHKILMFSHQSFLFLATFCNQLSQVSLLVTPIIIYIKVVKNHRERQHNAVDKVRLRQRHLQILQLVGHINKLNDIFPHTSLAHILSIHHLCHKHASIGFRRALEVFFNLGYELLSS
jgi:hypothetical protein